MEDLEMGRRYYKFVFLILMINCWSALACKDERRDCAKRALQGQCKTDPQMLIECEKSCGVCAFHSKERMLKDYLFNNYDKDVRPVIDENEITHVKLTMSIIHLIDLSLDMQTLILNGWIIMEWNDSLLTWNSSDFNNIDTVRMPNNLVWKPDMYIYNSADAANQAISSEALIVIYSGGKVLWVPPFVSQSLCDADLRYYPYDEHVCKVKVGSWTRNSFQMALSIYGHDNISDNEIVDISQDDFFNNNEWNLISTKALVNKTIYPCCAEPYSSITFFVSIKRKSSYYGCTLIALNIIAALATVCIFFLPPEKSKRVILAGIILIILTLLILHLASSLPPSNNKVPVVVVCPMVVAILTILALFISALLLHLTNGSMTNSVPQCLHVFCLEFLGRFLCIGDISNSPSILTVKINDDRICSVENASPSKLESGPGSRDITREVENQNRRHWYTIAVVINRLCLVCYIFIIVVVIIALCA